VFSLLEHPIPSNGKLQVLKIPHIDPLALPRDAAPADRACAHHIFDHSLSAVASALYKHSSDVPPVKDGGHGYGCSLNTLWVCSLAAPCSVVIVSGTRPWLSRLSSPFAQLPNIRPVPGARGESAGTMAAASHRGSAGLRSCRC